MSVVHCLSMELGTVFRRMLTARRETSVVALAIIEMMIDVPIEVIGSMKPGARPDEYASREPFRPVVAIRRAVIGGNLVVTIGTNRRCSDVHGNLRGGMRSCHRKGRTNDH